MKQSQQSFDVDVDELNVVDN